MKVLCLWHVPERLQTYFNTHLSDGITMIYPEDTSEANLCQLAANADMLIGWRPTESILNHAKKLKLVQNPGAGVQHLIPLFKKYPHIQLANCHGNAYFTAQHAVALLLSLTNCVVMHHSYMQNGIWRTGEKEGKSTPLRNLTVGLLGLGHVGKHIAQFISGFDVRIIACKRHPSTQTYPHIDMIYTQNELTQFLIDSDILIITVPLTEATKGLIGKHELELLGPTSFVVNMARGAVIHEKALYEALKNKTIQGAALDVWWNERVRQVNNEKTYPYQLPFHELSNVVLSPHRGASPMDDLRRWNPVIENIKRLQQGKPPQNVISLQNEY